MSYLDRRNFRKWLVTKQAPSATVGRRRSSCDCPIATYLTQNDVMGKAGARIKFLVGSYDIERKETWSDNTLPDYRITFKTPRWAKRFICEIDQTDDQIITASVALHVLDSIP